MTACGVLCRAPAERAGEEEWSLDAVVSPCSWRSLLAPITTDNFREASFDKHVSEEPRRRMELSTGQLCGVLFSLLAGTFPTAIDSLGLVFFFRSFFFFLHAISAFCGLPLVTERDGLR